ncbi:hypothetical protein B0H10DRAFT_1953674 [Mycena sp. CBHHK59/15]|nr:hypothetical protein B0H10DRAFT_1953674 [Mycena sp. CBHHK59/15]
MKLLFLLASTLVSSMPAVLSANSFAQSDRLTLLDGMQAVGMKVDAHDRPVSYYLCDFLRYIPWNQAPDRNARQCVLPAESALQAGDIYGSTYGDQGFYTNAGQTPLSLQHASRDQLQPAHHAHPQNPQERAPGKLPMERAAGIHLRFGDPKMSKVFCFSSCPSGLFTHVIALADHIRPVILQGDPRSPSNMLVWLTKFQSHPSWICNAALQICNNVGDPNQLIFTGGRSAGASVQSFFFGSWCPIGVSRSKTSNYTECAADLPICRTHPTDAQNFFVQRLLQLHALRGIPGAGRGQEAHRRGVGLARRQRAHGESQLGRAHYPHSHSHSEARVAYQPVPMLCSPPQAQKINGHKVPWLYWGLPTNLDPHQSEDYEIQVSGAGWSTISCAALPTAALTGAPFDFSTSPVFHGIFEFSWLTEVGLGVQPEAPMPPRRLTSSFVGDE